MKNYGHFPLGLTMVRASWSDSPAIEIQDGITPRRFFSKNKELFCPRPTVPGWQLHLMSTSQHPNAFRDRMRAQAPATPHSPPSTAQLLGGCLSVAQEMRRGQRDHSDVFICKQPGISSRAYLVISRRHLFVPRSGLQGVKDR